MKKLLTGVVAAVLLFLAGPAVALAHVDNPGQTPMKDNDALIFWEVARNKACGYSLGGLEEASSDAQGNAIRACQARGCTGADIQVSYLPWQDEEGYYHVCVGYVCTGCPAVAAR